MAATIKHQNHTFWAKLNELPDQATYLDFLCQNQVNKNQLKMPLKSFLHGLSEKDILDI